MIGYPSHAGERARRRLLTLDRASFGPRAILIGSVLVSSLALFVRPVTDTDFWLHAAVGRWIIEHGRLPAHDLYTYTVPDHRWVNHEYLSEVLLSLLRSQLGLAGVSVAFGVLAWLGLVLVLAACLPRSRPYPIVGAAVALGALAGAPVWGARPQMVTFVLVSLELLLLRRLLGVWPETWPRDLVSRCPRSGGGAEERSAAHSAMGERAPEAPTPEMGCMGAKDPAGFSAGPLNAGGRGIMWLPLIMAVWSNLHGGWPLGLLFIGLALASEAVRWVADRSPAHLARIRRLGVVGALSLLAVGLNPNGPSIYVYPFLTLASGAQQSLIMEWASPNFHLLSLRPFELMLLLLVAGLAVARPSMFDLLAALAGLVLALESARHVAIFVAAATPLLVALWSDAWRRLGAPALARGQRAALPRWAPAVGVVALLAVAAVVLPRLGDDLARQPDLTAQVVPVGAADWLAAHPATGTRMFNEYAWSGYLADRFFPDPNRRVFILSEAELMGDAQLLRYQEVAALRPGWRDVLERDRVDYVVVGRGSALDDVLVAEPGWRLAYRDRTAVIYVRAPA